MNNQSLKNTTNRHIAEMDLPSWEAYINLLSDGFSIFDDDDRQIVESSSVVSEPNSVDSKTCHIVTLRSNASHLIGAYFILDVAGRGKLKLAFDKKYIIGRADDSDLSLMSDTKASAKHAMLEYSRNKLVLVDLESTNGTFLNGTKIVSPEPLSNGDCIMVGKTEIRVYFD